MLHVVRNWANSFWIKAFLSLIILSFVAWGIGDMFRFQSPSNVISLGNSHVVITMNHYMRTLKSEVNHFQQMMGIQMDEAQVKQLQIPQFVVQKLIQQALIEAAANDMGLQVSNDTVLNFLKSQDFFKTDKGEFDPKRFHDFVLHQGLTEEAYIQSLRKDLSEHILLKALISIPIVPKALLEYAYQFEHENRYADIITIASSSIKVPSLPSPDILEKFYQEHQDHYVQPEARTIDYLLLNTDELKKDISISDAEYQEEFEQRKTEFPDQTADQIRPKLMSLLLSYKSEMRLHELSKTIDDELASGATLEEIASRSPATYKSAVTVNQKGDVLGKQHTLPQDSQFIPLVFSIDEGADSHLQLSENHQFYYVIHVKHVIPAQPRPLDEVKAEVFKDWQNREKENLLQEKAQLVRKEIESGKSPAALSDPSLNIDLGRKFSRAYSDEQKNQDPALTQAVFYLKKRGDVTLPIADNHYNLKIAVLQKITHPEKFNMNDLKSLDTHWSQQSTTMLMETYLRNLEKHYPVQLNERVFE